VTVANPAKQNQENHDLTKNTNLLVLAKVRRLASIVRERAPAARRISRCALDWT